ncbi:hypothetical protein J5N97_013071 [Dioscorea zingiberensis]|uniref:DUF4283 domain-containing protein n=1 Tax=Dioscorea zingiberensis TaxID=325984 RepID=A0A9D5HIQ4_9LILI|nr:hypothetical protein J5N97_013071 [Dioscorea zingiberensis]
MEAQPHSAGTGTMGKRMTENRGKVEKKTNHSTEQHRNTGQLAQEEATHQHISLAIDRDIVAGKQHMKRFSIISVKEIREGYVHTQKIRERLSELVDKGWNWPTKPLRDGRYIVECPSKETARHLESKRTPMVMPYFTLEFAAWMPDLWGPTRPDGEKRLVIIREFPFFCWSRVLAARLLKPVGHLIHIAGRTLEFGDDVKVFLRIRRPQTLPTFIHCTTGTRCHSYKVELVPGQPPLA